MIRIECKGAGLRPLDELTEFQGNLKSLSKENYRKLRKEIETVGFSEPVSVWKNGGKLYLLNGHQRVRTLKAMAADGVDIPKIPVNYVEAKDMKEAKRKVLALTSQYGEMEGEGLYEFMSEAGIEWPDVKDSFRFPEIDFKLWEEEFDTDPIVEDEVPEPPKDPATNYGDVWKLGNHTIRCWDSTDEMVAKDVESVPFMMITDPPYGVNYDPAWRNEAAKKGLIDFAASREGKVKNDDRVDWSAAFRWFLGDVAYVWHAGKHASDVARQLEAKDLEIRSQIIWKKPHFAISRGDYHWGHEPCWYAVRAGRSSQWCGGRSQSTIWEIAQVSGGEEATEHGTQKPIECMARPMRNHGKEGDLIYDPFLGSGTTLIAAEHLKRRCYGIEIDPGYCDVVIERWQNITGGKAKLIQGENLAYRQATASRKRLETKGVTV